MKKAFQTSSGFSVAPSFSLAVVPTVGSKDIDSKVRFAGAESTYNFTFADDEKVRSQLGIEAQKEKLEAEGHTIIQKGRKNIRYYVKDYENSLFDLK